MKRRSILLELPALAARCSDVRARTILLRGTAARGYATQTQLGSTGARKRNKPVTVFNDDGQVKWGDLSPAEKMARTTQQTFNSAVIVGAAILSVGVAYVLYTNVFSSESTTSHFNRAVAKVKSDHRCIEILGDAKNIRAFGEASRSRWTRNRPIASRVETDKVGTERLYMHFNVVGSLNEGVVRLHMLRRKDESEYHYGWLALDVRGHSRIYLENAEDQKKPLAQRKFLGIRWS